VISNDPLVIFYHPKLLTFDFSTATGDIRPPKPLRSAIDPSCEKA
jgi:hypothetical protein